LVVVREEIQSRDRRLVTTGFTFEPAEPIGFLTDNVIQTAISRIFIFDGRVWVPVKGAPTGELHVTTPEQRPVMDFFKFYEELSATLLSGTPAGMTTYTEVVAAAARDWLIRYLRLITPAEIEGNIYIETPDSGVIPILAPPQDESLDTTYDVRAIWGGDLETTRLRVWMRAKVALTADRTIMLRYSGRKVVR